jgi:hypothetical protein
VPDWLERRDELIPPDWHDPRDELIARVAPGHSFIDVGGLYGEKVSVAFRSGARSLTMLDIASPWRPGWASFRSEMAALGADVECIQADLFEVKRTFEVVHSSGVLYHQPNPLAYLEHLRLMTTDLAIVTSTVCPQEITNESGSLHLPAGAALFVPGMTDEEKAVLSSFFSSYGIHKTMLSHGRGHVVGFYGVNWWFPTAPAVEAMSECAGFTLEQSYRWSLDMFPAVTMLLRPTDAAHAEVTRA